MVPRILSRTGHSPTVQCQAAIQTVFFIFLPTRKSPFAAHANDSDDITRNLMFLWLAAVILIYPLTELRKVR
jgi:hypothetical protein